MKQNEMLDTLILELIRACGVPRNKRRIFGFDLDGLSTRGHAEKRALLRALMNSWMPGDGDEALLVLQDRYLEAEAQERILVDPRHLETVADRFGLHEDSLRTRLVLWRGDITTLAADAIVNAANAKLLGCFVPLHRCIDNAIHSAAGLRLRQACHELMEQQGCDEPTGHAKITPGFHLPSKHVLHTVGPIVNPERGPTVRDQALLKSCYRACLEQAAANPEIRTLAFCCISTGEYGYPKEEAAAIAIRTVTDFLRDGSGCQLYRQLDRVVFNVFTPEDERIYSELLAGQP